MKYPKLLFVLPLLIAAIGFISCEKDPVDKDDDTGKDDKDDVEKVEITVDPSGDIVFEAEGGSKTLKINSSGIEWDVTKTDWINVVPDFVNGKLEVVAGPCETKEGREGEINITGGAEPVVIKVSQKGFVPALSVDRNSLLFKAEGGVQVLTVTASHVEWEVESSADGWLEVTSDLQKGEIMLEAQENTDQEIRTCELIISGEGVESLKVTVSQEAAVAVDFWSRSAAERMGYSGKVNTVSKHIDLVNNNGFVEFIDLEFDAAGNLVKFNRGDAMTVTVTYDQENRMNKIAAKSADYDFAFLMEYGNHEHYIPIYEIFEYDLDVALPIDFRIWMPFFIKNLSALSVRDNLEPGNNMDYHFNTEGNTMTIDLYMEDGTPLYPQYYIIEFDGVYPKLLTSEGIETGIYETDPATGMIKHQVMYSYYDIEYFRNLDKANSISRAVFGEYDMSMQYNEHMDIASREGNHEDAIPSFTAEYKYDEAGNWLEATFKYKDGSAQPYSRTITYR